MTQVQHQVSLIIINYHEYVYINYSYILNTHDLFFCLRFSLESAFSTEQILLPEVFIIVLSIISILFRYKEKILKPVFYCLSIIIWQLAFIYLFLYH